MGVDVLNVYDLRDKSGTTLLSLGVHRLTGPHTAEMHSHHELELSWVRSGHGVYHIGDRQYDVAPGDVFLLNNTESHGLFLPEVPRHPFLPGFWKMFQHILSVLPD